MHIRKHPEGFVFEHQGRWCMTSLLPSASLGDPLIKQIMLSLQIEHEEVIKAVASFVYVPSEKKRK